MSKTKLKAVSRTQGNNRRVKEGAVTLPDFDLAFEEIPVLVQGFRRMVRQLEFDVCEMALTTYICAKAHGVKFTAIPIFLVRDFHHGAISHHVPSGLKTPADLTGKRVGVNRGYTVTTGVWARAIMQEEYGLDLSTVTWMPSGDEHVEAYKAPKNVVPLPDGDLEAHLASGDVVAAVGDTWDHPNIAQMIPNEFEAGAAALKNRGFYPINHTVAVRDDVLQKYPDAAVQIFEAFAESKRQYVADLKAGRIAKLSRVDQVHKVALEKMSDPLPYGIEPNRKTLENLVGHAVTQKIIPRSMTMEELFAKPVLNLVG